MHGVVTLIGSASLKKTMIPIEKSEELDMNLLEFLRSRNIPIASSCSGKGVCQKCIFNQDKLSCMEKVNEYLNLEIVIDYL